MSYARLAVRAAIAIAMTTLALELPGPATAQEQTAAAQAPAAETPARSRFRTTSWRNSSPRSHSIPTNWWRSYARPRCFRSRSSRRSDSSRSTRRTSPCSPNESWDGSVISLLNYPEVVKMMSEDLDWTQALGDALANQQKDVSDCDPAAPRRGGRQEHHQER